MKLEDLNLSERCLNELKGSGFETMEDIINFIENALPAVMTMSYECLKEATTKLIVLEILEIDDWGQFRRIK